MRKDEEAQVHILEMLTLFWLFFMSATFLIRVNVPDARSVAIDASLESAGEDAITASMALPPELIGDSRLHELLEEDAFDDDDRAGLDDRDLSGAGVGREVIDRRSNALAGSKRLDVGSETFVVE